MRKRRKSEEIDEKATRRCCPSACLARVTKSPASKNGQAVNSYLFPVGAPPHALADGMTMKGIVKLPDRIQKDSCKISVFSLHCLCQRGQMRATSQLVHVCTAAMRTKLMRSRSSFPPSRGLRFSGALDRGCFFSSFLNRSWSSCVQLLPVPESSPSHLEAEPEWRVYGFPVINLLVFSTAPNLRLGDGEYLDLEARAARVQFWTEGMKAAHEMVRFFVNRELNSDALSRA